MLNVAPMEPLFDWSARLRFACLHSSDDNSEVGGGGNRSKGLTLPDRGFCSALYRRSYLVWMCVKFLGGLVWGCWLGVVCVGAIGGGGGFG